MAVEKVGIYRKWLEPVPERNGKPIPKSEWPKKRRHCWIVRWYGTNGKRYGKVFKTRKETGRYALESQNRVCSGKADKPVKVTLRNFRFEHEQVMAGQVAHATVQEHLRALKLFENFIGGCILLSKIKPRHAEVFIAQRLASGLSNATVNKDIRTLRRVFNLAIEPRGYLSEGQNPFTKLKQRRRAKKPIRYFTTREYSKLMNAATTNWWKALISLAYGSGLRRSEILNLTWANVDFERQLVHVEPKKNSTNIIEWEPKDHESRVVPMSDVSAQLLADIQAEAREGHPYVFIFPERLKVIKSRQKSNNWTSRSEIINNLIRDFDVIRQRAGVQKGTLHDLRRSAITNWAQRLPIQVVQELAGHSSITTTRKYYLIVRSEDLVLAKQVLNSILAGIPNE